MALPVTITGISTAVACVGPFKRTAGTVYASVVDASTASTASTLATVSTSFLFAQTLQAQSAITINKVGVYLSVSSGTETLGTYYAEIRAGNDPAGTVLATSDTVTGGYTLTTAAQEIIFNFPTPATRSSSNFYAVDIYCTSTPGAGGTVRVHGNSSNDYSLGTAYTVIAGSNPLSLSARGSAPFDYRVNVYQTGTIASDAYYFFGRDGTTATTLQAFKSTAPDTSWSSVTSKTGFTTAILGLSAYQSGTVIHIAVMDGTASTSVAQKYISFDLATDTFLATIETISAAAATTGQIAGAGAANSIVVRSDGTAVIFYSGVQTKTSGTFRSRVYYRIRTALNTYGTETQVDANAAADTSTPTAVLGASNRVHFFWTTATSTGYRTLSAANALSTANSSASMAGPGDGCSYDRAGTTKVVVTSNGTGQTTARCDSSDNPTVTFGTPTAANATVPHRIGAFPQTSDVTIAYRNSSDGDLYTIKSTDDGATFGTAVNVFTGTVAAADANLSRNSSGGFYVSGARAVVGYIVNDNGTLKYNELYLNTPAVGAASGTGAAAAVSGANATGAASGVGTAQATGAKTAAAAGSAAGVGAAAADAYVPPVVSLRTVVSWVELSGTAADEDVVSGAGAAAGTGAASAVGAQTAAGQGAASGTGAAQATSIAGVAGSAAGVGAANGQSAQTAAATASASGTSTANAVSIAGVAGTAAGIGAASGVGLSTPAAVGAASGTSTAQATGAQTAGGVGAAIGAGAANGAAIAGVAGNASGVGVATATGASIYGAAGLAAGEGLLVGDSGGLAFGAGDAVGIGAASATGRATTSAVGASTGTGTAQATGAKTSAGAGAASGLGTATAVGATEGGEEVIVSAVGTAAGVGEADGRAPRRQPSAGLGGLFRFGPAITEGVGYGILPELEGYAVGTVGQRKTIAGRAKGVVALTGHASCDIGVKGAAYSVARLPLMASAVAAAGSAGRAEINLKTCTGVSMGDHDPDEHVVIALMMAA